MQVTSKIFDNNISKVCCFHPFYSKDFLSEIDFTKAIILPIFVTEIFSNVSMLPPFFNFSLVINSMKSKFVHAIFFLEDMPHI